MTDTDDPCMVALTDIYNIVGTWGRRPEPHDAIASRWLAIIAQLQALDPVFARWLHWENELGAVAFDPRHEVQVARVIAGTERTTAGRLVLEAGSRLWNMTDSDPRSRHITASMFAGSDNPFNSNNVLIKTDPCAVPDPDLVTYRIFRGALLAIAETFEATKAMAYPSDLADLWSTDRKTFKDLNLAWISYVAPRFAHLVTPPSSAIVEHRPNGGLLMAATDQTFVTANPTHLGVAREIHASLEAFNAVPWTQDSGK